MHKHLQVFWLIAAVAVGSAGCLDPDQSGLLVPKTVDQDPSLPAIEISVPGQRLPDGTRYPDTLLHAEAFGDPQDPMVLVLHGGPGGDYRGLLPLKALADDGYYVVFYDQRGGGLSQRHAYEIYSFPLLLEDLRQVIEIYSRSFPDRPFVFIGHSWGGMYATWFINEYGDYGGRVQGAIISEAGAFTHDELKDYMEKHMGSIEFFGEQLNDVTWLDQFLTPDGHASADYLETLRTAGGTPSEHVDPDNPAPKWRSGAVVKEAMHALAEEEDFDWTTNLDAYDRPVLFLRGDLNETMTLEHQTRAAAYYPNGYVVTMSDVGHEMIWERPAEYLEHTRAYFREIGFLGGAR